MKLWSSFLKETKIAFRGFYFYIEMLFAVILLVVVLVAVKEEPVSKSKEFLFYDMNSQVKEYYIEKEIDEGAMKKGEDTEFELKAVEFDVTNEETGDVETYSFEEEILTLKTYELLDAETGKLERTVYLTESEEDMLRLAYSEKQIGAVISVDDMMQTSYKYALQGYETDRYVGLLYIIHNDSMDAVEKQLDEQNIRTLGNVRTLNNRENVLPMFLAFSSSLMSFFIIMAYIFLDKDEGVIKAYAVTPSSVWKYLLSKQFVIMLTSIISSAILVIPIMGAKVNYLLLILFLVTTNFAMGAIGLLVSSFFNNIMKAFGALYIFMLAMMLPSFSYFIPSFDPVWLRYFPTYPMLQGFKEIILNDGGTGYVLLYSGVFLIGGIIIFMIANIRFKKTLTV